MIDFLCASSAFSVSAVHHQVFNRRDGLFVQKADKKMKLK